MCPPPLIAGKLRSPGLARPEPGQAVNNDQSNNHHQWTLPLPVTALWSAGLGSARLCFKTRSLICIVHSIKILTTRHATIASN